MDNIPDPSPEELQEMLEDLNENKPLPCSPQEGIATIQARLVRLRDELTKAIERDRPAAFITTIKKEIIDATNRLNEYQSLKSQGTN